VVGLSAYPTDDVREDALLAGFVEVVPKGHDPEAILELIRAFRRGPRSLERVVRDRVFALG
jgi:hypothetical protein